MFRLVLDAATDFGAEVNAAADNTRGFIAIILTLIAAPTWLAWWNARVTRRELSTNGGRTVADKLDRIESRQLTMWGRMELHGEQIDLLMDERGMRRQNEFLKDKYTQPLQEGRPDNGTP